MNRLLPVALLASLICVGCGHRDLRGSYAASQDGKTYLVFVNAQCQLEPPRVDGKVWPHPIGEVGPIEPGLHSVVECGEIGFTIPRGVVYKFDYWGP